jgi:hypothetical protein
VSSSGSGTGDRLTRRATHHATLVNRPPTDGRAERGRLRGRCRCWGPALGSVVVSREAWSAARRAAQAWSPFVSQPTTARAPMHGRVAERAEGLCRDTPTGDHRWGRGDCSMWERASDQQGPGMTGAISRPQVSSATEAR